MQPRRAALAVALVALSLASGCLAVSGPTDATGTEPAPIEHEVAAFDHLSEDAPAIEGGITVGDDLAGDELSVTTVTSAADTDRFDEAVLDDAANAFVADTDFDSAYLVVAESYPESSVPDYRVASLERRNGTLHVAIDDSSDGGTDDVTIETVLIRVHDEPPERVELTTNDGRTAATDATPEHG